MLYLLQKEEKSALKNLYNKNVIYRAFKAPCEEYEASSEGFKLSPEEVFWECISALDDIRENPEELTFNFQDFWDEKYNEYRDINESNFLKGPEEAASIVTMCLYLCLNATSCYEYNTLSLLIMRQLEEKCTFLDTLKEKFMANIYRLDERKFIEAVNDYIYGDIFISDDIEELLNNSTQNKPDIVINPSNNRMDKTGKNIETLTIRQLLILLDVGFDIGFTPETTDVLAYARLIALMTGRKPGSIRTTMYRIKNIDYNSKEVRDDVKYLVELLEPVKAELAIKLKNQIINKD